MDVALTSGSCFAGPVIPGESRGDKVAFAERYTEVQVYRYVALESTFLFAAELIWNRRLTSDYTLELYLSTYI